MYGINQHINSAQVREAQSQSQGSTTMHYHNHGSPCLPSVQSSSGLEPGQQGQGSYVTLQQVQPTVTTVTPTTTIVPFQSSQSQQQMSQGPQQQQYFQAQNQAPRIGVPGTMSGSALQYETQQQGQYVIIPNHTQNPNYNTNQNQIMMNQNQNLTNMNGIPIIHNPGQTRPVQVVNGNYIIGSKGGNTMVKPQQSQYQNFQNHTNAQQSQLHQFHDNRAQQNFKLHHCQKQFEISHSDIQNPLGPNHDYLNEDIGQRYQSFSQPNNDLQNGSKPNQRYCQNLGPSPGVGCITNHSEACGQSQLYPASQESNQMNSIIPQNYQVSMSQPNPGTTIMINGNYVQDGICTGATDSQQSQQSQTLNLTDSSNMNSTNSMSMLTNLKRQQQQQLLSNQIQIQSQHDKYRLNCNDTKTNHSRIQVQASKKNHNALHQKLQPWMVQNGDISVKLGKCGYGRACRVEDPLNRLVYYMCMHCKDRQLFPSTDKLRNHLKCCPRRLKFMCNLKPVTEESGTYSDTIVNFNPQGQSSQSATPVIGNSNSNLNQPGGLSTTNSTFSFNLDQSQNQSQQYNLNYQLNYTFSQNIKQATQSQTQSQTFLDNHDHNTIENNTKIDTNQKIQALNQSHSQKPSNLIVSNKDVEFDYRYTDSESDMNFAITAQDFKPINNRVKATNLDNDSNTMASHKESSSSTDQGSCNGGSNSSCRENDCDMLVPVQVPESDSQEHDLVKGPVNQIQKFQNLSHLDQIHQPKTDKATIATSSLDIVPYESDTNKLSSRINGENRIQNCTDIVLAEAPSSIIQSTIINSNCQNCKSDPLPICDRDIDCRQSDTLQVPKVTNMERNPDPTKDLIKENITDIIDQEEILLKNKALIDQLQLVQMQYEYFQKTQIAVNAVSCEEFKKKIHDTSPKADHHDDHVQCQQEQPVTDTSNSKVIGIESDQNLKNNLSNANQIQTVDNEINVKQAPTPQPELYKMLSATDSEHSYANSNKCNSKTQTVTDSTTGQISAAGSCNSNSSTSSEFITNQCLQSPRFNVMICESAISSGCTDKYDIGKNQYNEPDQQQHILGNKPLMNNSLQSDSLSKDVVKFNGAESSTDQDNIKNHRNTNSSVGPISNYDKNENTHDTMENLGGPTAINTNKNQTQSIERTISDLRPAVQLFKPYTDGSKNVQLQESQDQKQDLQKTLFNGDNSAIDCKFIDYHPIKQTVITVEDASKTKSDSPKRPSSKLHYRLLQGKRPSNPENWMPTPFYRHSLSEATTIENADKNHTRANLNGQEVQVGESDNKAKLAKSSESATVPEPNLSFSLVKFSMGSITGSKSQSSRCNNDMLIDSMKTYSYSSYHFNKFDVDRHGDKINNSFQQRKSEVVANKENFNDNQRLTVTQSSQVASLTAAVLASEKKNNQQFLQTTFESDLDQNYTNNTRTSTQIQKPNKPKVDMTFNNDCSQSVLSYQPSQIGFNETDRNGSINMTQTRNSQETLDSLSDIFNPDETHRSLMPPDAYESLSAVLKIFGSDSQNNNFSNLDLKILSSSCNLFAAAATSSSITSKIDAEKTNQNKTSDNLKAAVNKQNVNDIETFQESTGPNSKKIICSKNGNALFKVVNNSKQYLKLNESGEKYTKQLQSEISIQGPPNKFKLHQHESVSEAKKIIRNSRSTVDESTMNVIKDDNTTDISPCRVPKNSLKRARGSLTRDHCQHNLDKLDRKSKSKFPTQYQNLIEKSEGRMIDDQQTNNESAVNLKGLNQHHNDQNNDIAEQVARIATVQKWMQRNEDHILGKKEMFDQNEVIQDLGVDSDCDSRNKVGPITNTQELQLFEDLRIAAKQRGFDDISQAPVPQYDQQNQNVYQVHGQQQNLVLEDVAIRRNSKIIEQQIEESDCHINDKQSSEKLGFNTDLKTPPDFTQTVLQSAPESLIEEVQVIDAADAKDSSNSKLNDKSYIHKTVTVVVESIQDQQYNNETKQQILNADAGRVLVTDMITTQSTKFSSQDNHENFNDIESELQDPNRDQESKFNKLDEFSNRNTAVGSTSTKPDAQSQVLNSDYKDSDFDSNSNCNRDTESKSDSESISNYSFSNSAVGFQFVTQENNEGHQNFTQDQNEIQDTEAVAESDDLTQTTVTLLTLNQLNQLQSYKTVKQDKSETEDNLNIDSYENLCDANKNTTASEFQLSHNIISDTLAVVKLTQNDKATTNPDFVKVKQSEKISLPKKIIKKKSNKLQSKYTHNQKTASGIVTANKWKKLDLNLKNSQKGSLASQADSSSQQLTTTKNGDNVNSNVDGMVDWPKSPSLIDTSTKLKSQGPRRSRLICVKRSKFPAAKQISVFRSAYGVNNRDSKFIRRRTGNESLISNLKTQTIFDEDLDQEIVTESAGGTIRNINKRDQLSLPPDSDSCNMARITLTQTSCLKNDDLDPNEQTLALKQDSKDLSFDTNRTNEKHVYPGVVVSNTRAFNVTVKNNEAAVDSDSEKMLKHKTNENQPTGTPQSESNSSKNVPDTDIEIKKTSNQDCHSTKNMHIKHISNSNSLAKSIRQKLEAKLDKRMKTFKREVVPAMSHLKRKKVLTSNLNKQSDIEHDVSIGRISDLDVSCFNNIDQDHGKSESGQEFANNVTNLPTVSEPNPSAFAIKSETQSENFHVLSEKNIQKLSVSRNTNLNFALDIGFKTRITMWIWNYYYTMKELRDSHDYNSYLLHDVITENLVG